MDHQPHHRTAELFCGCVEKGDLMIDGNHQHFGRNPNEKSSKLHRKQGSLLPPSLFLLCSSVQDMALADSHGSSAP